MSVEPARRLPRLWAFLLRRGFAPRLVHARLAALWPRWADALAGLEPAEHDNDADDPGQQQAASGCPGDES